MPEVRLIDSETLKSRIGELCLNNDDLFTAKAYERIIGVIEATPTIEAELVRHGRWKKKNGEIYCTNCKKSKWSESFELMLRGFDFCPKCGARMYAEDINVLAKDGGADNG